LKSFESAVIVAAACNECKTWIATSAAHAPRPPPAAVRRETAGRALRWDASVAEIRSGQIGACYLFDVAETK
jgi:hypothetical protein